MCSRSGILVLPATVPMGRLEYAQYAVQGVTGSSVTDSLSLSGVLQFQYEHPNGLLGTMLSDEGAKRLNRTKASVNSRPLVPGSWFLPRPPVPVPPRQQRQRAAAEISLAPAGMFRRVSVASHAELDRGLGSNDSQLHGNHIQILPLEYEYDTYC